MADFNNPNLKKFVDFMKKLGFLSVIIVLALYLATGIYTVGPDEKAVVLTFGKYTKESNPGLNWYFPAPIGKVIKVKTTKVYREEIGFRTIDPGPPAKYQDKRTESLMLTGDENIVEIDFTVQYKINNVKKFLFNVKNQRKLVYDAAQASLRTVVGNTTLENILTVGKGEVQSQTQEKLQKLLDIYDSGISIVNIQLQDVQPPQEVLDAFKDVASAREDKVRYINEANGYSNDILPKARGEAEKLINEALAYKEKRIKEAEGDVARFLQLYEKYQLGKEVTKTRLYLETLEKVMPNVDKTIIDKNLDSGLLNIIDKGGITNEK
ncbi:MAG: modulator of FtsH protease HflK [Fusobacteriaceae bacterium]|jgi:membrane protease subunit HflK|nr:modulator of FtsH protease HflK [Fusobacteriaceae bacterium]